MISLSLKQVKEITGDDLLQQLSPELLRAAEDTRWFCSDDKAVVVGISPLVQKLAPVHLWIHPAHRKSAILRKYLHIFEDVISAVRYLGGEGLLAIAPVSNKSAINLHERLGFTKVPFNNMDVVAMVREV